MVDAAVTVPLLDHPLESAVVDEAHLGDIEGALGSVRWRQLWPPRTRRRRIAVLLTVMGPGLLALVADNDAGGVSTYAQAGQQEGMRLLWVLLPLGLVLFVNQEMAARLGAVSGVGHARLIVERFGRLWGAFSLGDLVVLNVLTLVTEFIGVRFAAAQLGLPPVPAVAGAAALLLLASLTGSFRHWERVMFLLVAADVALLPVLLAHPAGAAGAGAGVGPHGGAPFPVLAMALVGTTVAPWQLFFQQSVVVDKRITPAWLGFERVDTAIGTVLMLLGAGAVLLIAAAAGGAGHAVATGDTGAIVHTIGQRLGATVGDVVALLLLDGAVLGATAVTLATSYAVGDVSGARHSLHRTPRDAPVFYAVLVGLAVGAAAVAMLPGVPLGLITVAVQVLAGLLLPGATVFLLLLCNDAAVLGPWVNRPWLNALAAVTVAGLLVLSAVLVVTTLVPHVPVHVLAPVLGGVAAVGLLVVGVPRRRVRTGQRMSRLSIVRGAVLVVDRRRRVPGRDERDRRAWRTPPLHELRRPAWTRGRTAGIVALRAYVLVSLLVLLGRAVAEALER
jgi:Mn2+/Fe2+ NRAMP family transporter